MGFILTTAIDAENPVLHDLKLVNGQLSFVIPSLDSVEDYGIEIAQRIKTRLLHERGDWYQNQLEGVPWSSKVLGKAGIAAGLDSVRQLVYDVVLSTPGVQSVTDVVVELDKSTRDLSIDIKATAATSREISLTGLRAPFVVQS
jgi:hypothetical protein